MRSRSITHLDGKPRWADVYRQGVCRGLLRAAVREGVESGVFGLLADTLFRHSLPSICSGQAGQSPRGNPQGLRVSGDGFGRGLARGAKVLASGAPLDSRVRGNDGKALVTQHGFVLASAIFLLVIMAALAAFIVQVSVASQTASAMDVQGARAYQAARLGIEAGLYSVRPAGGGACPSSPIVSIPELTGFSVYVSCVATEFTENGTDKKIWQITSTASYGVVTSSDYVERQLIATTEAAP